jgi:hypothetical protein
MWRQRTQALKTETIVYIAIALVITYFLFFRSKTAGAAQQPTPPAPAEPSIIDQFAAAIANARQRIGFDYGGGKYGGGMTTTPTYATSRRIKTKTIATGSPKGAPIADGGCRCARH